MERLIVRLRGMAEAGESDYTVAGSTYWSGDHLQGVLDRFRSELRRVPLRADYDINLEYHDYFAGRSNLEGAESGTAAWSVESGDVAVGTAGYTVNYEAGHLYFADDTEGSALYLTARAFDLNRAAAEVWQQKAAHAAAGYMFRADGAEYNRQQVFEHCLAMAAHYRGLSGVRVTRLFRSDAPEAGDA